MRKFLYPLFFVAALSLVLYFFGEDLSSFWRKFSFVALLVSLFFLFRNLIFSVFGFLFSRFSNIVRNILGVVLFLGLFWALWSFLVPDDFKARVAGGKNAIESTISTEKGEVASAVTEQKKGIFGWLASKKENAETGAAEMANNVAENTKEKTEESKGWFASLFSKKEDSTSVDTVENANQSGENTENQSENQSEKKGWFASWFSSDEHAEDEKLNNGGLFSYETDGQTNVSGEVGTEKKSEESETSEESLAQKNGQNAEQNGGQAVSTSGQNSGQENGQIAENGTVVPLTNDLTNDSANAQKESSAVVDAAKNSEISLVKKMATTGADLTATGPNDTFDEVVFDSEDAKMVFPAGYAIADLQHIAKASAQEKMQFAVEKNGQKAIMQVALFAKGSTKKFDEYAEFFTQVPADGSVSFVMTEVSENKTVYVSFFEGIMWEFSITSSQKMSENDLYSFLAPVAFKKKIEN